MGDGISASALDGIIISGGLLCPESKTVGGALDASATSVEDMRVDHGGADIVVAE